MRNCPGFFLSKFWIAVGGQIAQDQLLPFIYKTEHLFSIIFMRACNLLQIHVVITYKYTSYGG